MHGSRSLLGGVMPGFRSVLGRGGYVWSQVPSEGRWVCLVSGPFWGRWACLVPGSFLDLGKPGK